MQKTQRKNRLTLSSAQTLNAKDVMSLDQIVERLVRSILSGTLALQILRNSRKPTYKLVNELLEIEMEVGQFVGRAMHMHAKSFKASNMGGMLANTLSFIPMGQAEVQTQVSSSKLPAAIQKPQRVIKKISSPKSKRKKRNV